MAQMYDMTCEFAGSYYDFTRMDYRVSDSVMITYFWAAARSATCVCEGTKTTAVSIPAHQSRYEH